jgi:hypothetical protein
MIDNLNTVACRKLTTLMIALCFWGSYSLKAQTAMPNDSIVVQGIVVSGTNRPLPDVTISIEGAKQLPVVTNEAGEFEIKVESGNKWLTFSPIGDYKARRVFLNGREFLKVFLTASDLAANDDQLTVLSQTYSRKDIVCSFYDIEAPRSYKTSSLVVDELMQGRVSGFNVIRKDGNPGTGAVTFLRGVTSIITNSQPLFVVDGVPVENCYG